MRRSRSFALLVLLLIVVPATGALAVPEGIRLTWPGGSAGKVVFDGTVHARKGLSCDVCHVAGVFHTKKDADHIDMEALRKEKYCGTCHNGVKAFGTKDAKSCVRCHEGKKSRP